ncbi:MAG TPA: SRPBCC family protein [Opitutaceae bacterium]|jgi:ligand-binding SRPBCC domain-containing protein
MPVIRTATVIAAPIGVVFDLARDIGAHALGQARHGERAVAGRTSGLIGLGEEVTWEAVHLGFRQRLTSRVTEMRAPVYFRDRMLRGAFRRLDHGHFFEEMPRGGTRMTDVAFESPLGPLGRLVDALFLGRHMRGLLEERNAALRALAEAAARPGGA